MPITSAEIDKILNLLEETPLRMTSMTCGVETARLYVKPNEAAWAMNDILAHLRACAEVWGKSMLAMIVQMKFSTLSRWKAY